jgi:hypothetical protein
MKAAGPVIAADEAAYPIPDRAADHAAHTVPDVGADSDYHSGEWEKHRRYPELFPHSDSHRCTHSGPSR